MHWFCPLTTVQCIDRRIIFVLVPSDEIVDYNYLPTYIENRGQDPTSITYFPKQNSRQGFPKNDKFWFYPHFGKILKEQCNILAKNIPIQNCWGLWSKKKRPYQRKFWFDFKNSIEYSIKTTSNIIRNAANIWSAGPSTRYKGSFRIRRNEGQNINMPFFGIPYKTVANVYGAAALQCWFFYGIRKPASRRRPQQASPPGQPASKACRFSGSKRTTTRCEESIFFSLSVSRIYYLLAL